MELFGHKLKFETPSGRPWVHALPVSGTILQLILQRQFDTLERGSRTAPVRTETHSKTVIDTLSIVDATSRQCLVRRERTPDVDSFSGRITGPDGEERQMGHRDIFRTITRAMELQAAETTFAAMEMPEIAPTAAGPEPTAVIHTA
jgi:hypothetical protein